MAIAIGLLQVLGILAGTIALYLLVVALAPGFSVEGQSLERGSARAGTEGAAPPAARRQVSFPVGGATVRAWLFLPDDQTEPGPCIIMAHGLGGTKRAGLEPYAARFQKAGFAVLVFDYRHLGESDGEPRQLIWIPRQLEDWAASVAYARGLPEVDPARIALWGTSLSGGHVLVTASRDGGIACVSAQCPGLDGRASALMALKRGGVNLRLIAHGQRDLVRSWLGLSPHRVPIAGRPGSLALLNTPDAFEAFSRLAPDGFVNEACARIILRGDKYRPIRHVGGVRCPVLLQICDRDELTPASAAEEAAKTLGGHAEVKRYPIGHFDVYFGEAFERGVSDQLGFFERHLLPRTSSRGDTPAA